MDFIRADKLYKRERAKQRKEKSVVTRKYLKFSILLLFFMLGFVISALIFYRAASNFPPSQISAENVELIPIVDRNYFSAVLSEINGASESIDMAMFEFKFYENEGIK
mgnify:FL=1